MAHVVENVRKRQRMHTKDTAVLKHRLDGADGRECTKNAVEKRIREIESETPARRQSIPQPFQIWKKVKERSAGVKKVK